MEITDKNIPVANGGFHTPKVQQFAFCLIATSVGKDCFTRFSSYKTQYLRLQKSRNNRLLISQNSPLKVLVWGWVLSIDAGAGDVFHTPSKTSLFF